MLGALYLLFNEGYKASSGERLVREDLCHEAIRLATLLAAHPATDVPRTFSLLSLMFLNGARIAARTDDAGNLVRLHEQNRAAWDQSMIQRGKACLSRAAQDDEISAYHLFHVLRGIFAAETGNQAAAFLHFRQAGALASPPAERDFITRRVRECAGAKGAGE